MKSIQITSSAVLYFDRAERRCVPIEWFERARELFNHFNLSPILFTASADEDFLLDDCYVLAERGNDITLWGEHIPARRDDLMTASRNGRVDDIGLDSPREGARSRSDEVDPKNWTA